MSRPLSDGTTDMTTKKTAAGSARGKLRVIGGRSRGGWNAAGILVVLALVVVLPSLLVIAFIGPQRTLQDIAGTVAGLRRADDDVPVPTRLWVALDDGRAVEVRGAESRPYNKGERIVVREQRSGMLGLRRFDFVRPLDSPAYAPTE
jgi:hypothetical protein